MCETPNAVVLDIRFFDGSQNTLLKGCTGETVEAELTFKAVAMNLLKAASRIDLVAV